MSIYIKPAKSAYQPITKYINNAETIYNTEHKSIVGYLPNFVAIVFTPASLSAFMSGTAENACIAIARAIPAIT